MAEYTFDQQIAFKLNLTNVTDKLYADSLYRGHYIPGRRARCTRTVTARF